MDDSDQRKGIATGTLCAYCLEDFSPFDGDGPPVRLNPETQQRMHRACVSRNIMGSMGHQLKLCSCFGGTVEDPPGLTRRQAALASWFQTAMSAQLNGLDMYQVFYNPSDYPGKYVVRLFKICAGGPIATPQLRVVDTLDEAREQIPQGLACIPRSAEDEVSMVESWF